MATKTDEQTLEVVSDPALKQWRRRLHSASSISASRETSAPRIERPRTVSEAAEELGLSVHTVRAWIASRRLGYLRLGRAIRIPASEIRRILEKSLVPAAKEE